MTIVARCMRCAQPKSLTMIRPASPAFLQASKGAGSEPQLSYLSNGAGCRPPMPSFPRKGRDWPRRNTRGRRKCPRASSQRPNSREHTHVRRADMFHNMRELKRLPKPAARWTYRTRSGRSKSSRAASPGQTPRFPHRYAALTPQRARQTDIRAPWPARPTSASGSGSPEPRPRCRRPEFAGRPGGLPADHPYPRPATTAGA